MNDEAKQVIARLSGKTIVCPDCGKTLETVRIEYSTYQEVRIDYEKNRLRTIPGEGKPGKVLEEPRYRCPHCESLNVDELINERELGYRFHEILSENRKAAPAVLSGPSSWRKTRRRLNSCPPL